MDAKFWHDRWSERQIGFHEGAPNALLARHFERVFGKDQRRVFVPLCGKAMDLQWLHARGHHVLGAELSKIAVEEFFEEMGVEPHRSEEGGLVRYSAERLDIFQGDVFALDAAMLGQIDAVYDRAALVALPKDMRDRYTQHLVAITGNAPQLLIAFAYDQSLMDGPPFSVSSEEIDAHYAAHFDIEDLETVLSRNLKGKIDANETIRALRPKSFAP